MQAKEMGKRGDGRGSPMTGGCCCAGRNAALLGSWQWCLGGAGKLPRLQQQQDACKGSPRSWVMAMVTAYETGDVRGCCRVPCPCGCR